MSLSLLDTLAAKLGAELRGHRYHATCPWCGKDAKSGQTHFILDDRGAKCFVCGQSATLPALAHTIKVNPDGLVIAQRVERPRPPAPFAMSWAAWQAANAPHTEVIAQAWNQYKPVSLETIRRYGLSIGNVPLYDERRNEWKPARCGYRTVRRLIVPILGGGQVIGVAARAYQEGDDLPKWLTPGSKAYLQGLGQVRAESTVVVVENYFDRIALAVARPGVTPVATGGLFWRDEWTAELVRRQPSEIIIWYDHDISGNGSIYHADRWLREWRAEIIARRKRERREGLPMPADPEPFGPRLANRLSDAGLKVRLFAWPKEAKYKADVGDVLVGKWKQ